MSQAYRADSPTRHDDIVVTPDAPPGVAEGTSPERISGAIARAVRKNATGRQRREPLPNVALRLRADRARAIAQRDVALREVKDLRRQLQRTRSDLALAVERASAAERAAQPPKT